MLLLLLQPRWNSRENEKRHWPELLLLLLLLVQPTRTVGRQQSLRDAHFGACADKSGVPPEREGKEKEKGGLLLPQTRGPLQSILHHYHRPQRLDSAENLLSIAATLLLLLLPSEWQSSPPEQVSEQQQFSTVLDLAAVSERERVVVN